MIEILIFIIAFILVIAALAQNDVIFAALIIFVAVCIWPQDAKGATLVALTANQDWKVFYAIMICAIWAMIYWLLKPIGEIVISWCLPKGTTYADVQTYMGLYLCLMLLGCMFNLSLLGG
jgi:hypothetical protein